MIFYIYFFEGNCVRNFCDILSIYFLYKNSLENKVCIIFGKIGFNDFNINKI